MSENAEVPPVVVPQQLFDRKSFFEAMPVKTRYTVTDIPGFGQVRIRSLSDAEYSKLQSFALKADGKLNKPLAETFSARLIVACVVDGDGNCILTESDVAELRKRDSRTVEEIARACRAWVGAPEEEEVKNE